MRRRTIHPFPARMAPELALNTLNNLPAGSVVLDPMVGSGTVLRQAIELGHRAIGFDLDPLAVLMSRVWTTPVDDDVLETLTIEVIKEARMVDLRTNRLQWMSNCQETTEFIKYWFAPEQRRDLTRLAYVLHRRSMAVVALDESIALDVMRIALSRIIVTKEQVASLARDTSHSRPHKVSETCEVDIFETYSRSLDQLRKRLRDAPPPADSAIVRQGDARTLELPNQCIDAVMTSPPYLNAIDYLRGHRMALVWLGYGLTDLRAIRSTSIGAERGGAKVADDEAEKADMVVNAMLGGGELPRNYGAMVRRYAQDLLQMSAEIKRVLKPGAQATFVVGNSCLKGIFVKNSGGVETASLLAGMGKVTESERELPASNRYLPVTADGALGKRMRTETVLTFSA